MSLDGATAVTPAARSQVRRWRGPLLLAVVVVVVSVLLALAQGQRTRGYLDPDAVDASGAGALSALLADQGVDVVRVTSAEDARDALYRTEGTKTLLVAAELAPISYRMADLVTSVPFSHLVVVGGDPESLTNLASWATVVGVGTSQAEIPPDCDWDLAQRVGPLVADGQQYASKGVDVTVCWDAFVLDLPVGTGEKPTTLLGSGRLLTNDVLADSGNAALGLNVLGRDQTVVWWLPSLTDPLQPDDEEGASITDLVPSWVALAVAQVLAALLITVWWRGRRLGRVVLEPLPVVVRATEAVEGRARLYRRASDRGRAADVLRSATASRLTTLLRLPRTSGLGEIVPAVVARTGRDATSVTALLTPGVDPTDDASLTRLADALDTLEDEVRRS